MLLVLVAEQSIFTFKQNILRIIRNARFMTIKINRINHTDFVNITWQSTVKSLNFDVAIKAGSTLSRT